MICGLPPQLQPPAGPCSFSDRQATDGMLLAHHQADYPSLISKLCSWKARRFLLTAIAVNHWKRLTPAAALRHRFLASRAAAVEARVVETSPANTEQVRHILGILGPLQDQPGVFLAAHHHQQHLPEEQSLRQQCSAWPSISWPRFESCSYRAYKLGSCNSNGTMDVAASAASGSSSPRAAAQPVDVITSCSVTSSIATAKLEGPMTPASCSTGTTATGLMEEPMTSTGSPTAADAAGIPDAAGKPQKKLAGRLFGKLMKSVSGNNRSKKLFGGSKAAVSPGTGGLSPTELLGADAVVVVEPVAVGVSVPGFCGLRWWGSMSQKVAGGKVGV